MVRPLGTTIIILCTPIRTHLRKGLFNSFDVDPVSQGNICVINGGNGSSERRSNFPIMTIELSRYTAGETRLITVRGLPHRRTSFSNCIKTNIAIIDASGCRTPYPLLDRRWQLDIPADNM